MAMTLQVSVKFDVLGFRRQRGQEKGGSRAEYLAICVRRDVMPFTTPLPEPCTTRSKNPWSIQKWRLKESCKCSLGQFPQTFSRPLFESACFKRCSLHTGPEEKPRRTQVFH